MAIEKVYLTDTFNTWAEKINANIDASNTATTTAAEAINKANEAIEKAESAAPKKHDSPNDIYGLATDTNYGHVKLSDSTSSTNAVANGTAATPKAVKVAKDAADAAMSKASTLATASDPGIVKPGTGMTVNTAGALNVSLNNTVTSTSKTQAATANAVKIAYDKAVEASNKAVEASNKAVEASNKAGLPLGHIYLWPFTTPPDGSIQVNGSTYSRQLYADLWALIQTKGWYKSESEWQSIANANGGYCPWYSDGDGSTTFRTPKFAPYQKLALASGDAGKYYSAGLPNFSVVSKSLVQTNDTIAPVGTLLKSSNNNYGIQSAINSYGHTSPAGIILSASALPQGTTFGADNTIYGNSTTVTPESHNWIVCVVAFGTATNVGSVDVSNVMSAVGTVQADVATKLSSDTVHVVSTWSADDNSSWYEKWSNGFIIQGGNIPQVESDYTRVSLPIPFSTTKYSVVLGQSSPITKYSSYFIVTSVNWGSTWHLTTDWIAAGY